MVKQFFKERLGTVIFLAILAIVILAGWLSIKDARNHAITYSEDYEAPARTADLSTGGEYKVIAENDKLRLYYNDVRGTVKVENLENGYVWDSVWPDEKCADVNAKNKVWKAKVTSAVFIKYSDLKKRDSAIAELYSAKDCGYLESEYIENGVSVTYGFLTPGLYVTVEYTLQGDELVVRVPGDRIKEYSKYAITTVEVLPYFGACDNSNDGYLFYPDGSGAVTTFAKTSERPSSVKFATYYTYTNKNVNFTNLMDDNMARYTASFPVCGIKNGDNAFYVYATESKENTAITVYPSGYVVTLNHIGFELYMRNTFAVNSNNVSSGRDTVNTGKAIQRVDKKIIDEDKELRYGFLTGDNANYSGMAVAYRDYLVESGQLTMSDSYGEYALALKLLMGTKKAGVIFDENVTMTDFDNAKEILENLKDKGVLKTDAIIYNWSDTDGKWKPKSSLGGKSGLKSLSEYAEQNDSVDIFLDTYLLLADTSTKRFDRDDDVAYDGLGIEISLDYGTYHEYLLNPYAAIIKNRNLLKDIKKYDGLGIAYRDAGVFAYPDYNELHPYKKTEMTEAVKGLLSETKDTDRFIAMSGENQYVLSNADLIYDISDDCYGLAITDYAVPFKQMVLSGFIPYASGGAGNLAYDLTTQKLKWIEYGSMPVFFLTYESALELRNTGWSTLFSSTYSTWEPVVIETYNELKNALGEVYDRQIVYHEIINDDVRKTVYDNGITVYVNYGNTDFTTGGITVPANAYKVAGGKN